jgi:hypothetical protein
LCNFSINTPLEIAEDILAALLPAYAQRLQADRSKSDEREEQVPFAAPPELLGSWEGAASTYQGERAVKMRFQEDGDIHVQIDDQLVTLVSEAWFADGELRGVFAGDIGTDDAGRRPYHLSLRLKLRGDLLNGSLTALSKPGPRPGDALSYWIELARETAAESK